MGKRRRPSDAPSEPGETARATKSRISARSGVIEGGVEKAEGGEGKVMRVRTKMKAVIRGKVVGEPRGGRAVRAATAVKALKGFKVGRGCVVGSVGKGNRAKVATGKRVLKGAKTRGKGAREQVEEVVQDGGEEEAMLALQEAEEEDEAVAVAEVRMCRRAMSVCLRSWFMCLFLCSLLSTLAEVSVPCVCLDFHPQPIRE